MTALVDAAVHDALVDEAVVLRRCALYRRSFRGIAVSLPAEVLWMEAVTNWVREHGVTVDVGSTEELWLARSTGILLARTVMHCGDIGTPTVHCAVNLGAARFVVDSTDQVERLSSGMGRTRQVIVDADSPEVGHLVGAVAEQGRLNLIGFHSRVDGYDGAAIANGVRSMIALMAQISWEHRTVLTRISLAGVDGGDDPRDLRRLAAEIDEAVEDGCIRFGHPRPAVTLSPSRTALRLE